MIKKSLFGIIILTLIILGVYQSYKFFNNEIYPFLNMKGNDTADWVLRVTKIPDEDILVVSDNKLLYENRFDFKVKMDNNVYMSTPGYLVRVFINGEEVQNYPILYLEQIDFGTIPH